MYTVSQIVGFLNHLASPSLAEDYDNVGLLVGDGSASCTGVLTTLDVTYEVINEAVTLGFNTIVAHHPLIFKGLKKLTNGNYVERAIIQAIKNDVNIIALHTNLDNVSHGVNKYFADALGLVNQRILASKENQLLHLTVMVPKENAEKLQEALFEAGAGSIGNYSHCSFNTEGTGTFKPNDGAKPSIGSIGELEKVNEMRVEVILPAYSQSKVLSAMWAAHPYEEVAYFLNMLKNTWKDVGSGMIAELQEPMNTLEFLSKVKETLGTGCIRHTAITSDEVKKVALCGGSGSFLINKAKAAGAQVYITADVKYHEFFDADGQITVADVGHFESEQFVPLILAKEIQQKFRNIAVQNCKVPTNPISYL